MKNRGADFTCGFRKRFFGVLGNAWLNLFGLKARER